VAVPPTHNNAVEHEQDDRADDGCQPGRDVEKLIERVRPEESGREKATQERTGDTDERGHDQAAWVVSGHDRLRDQASEQAEDDERDDALDRPFARMTV
jgi:hypothetical protein